jgi:hypothetical protein
MNNKQLDMVLDYLNEGTEIDKEKFLNEGFFQKLKDLFKKDKTKTKNDTKFEKNPGSGKSTITEEERIKAFNESVKIAKKVINDFKKECKNHKDWDKYVNCFEANTDNLNTDDFEYDDYLSGDSKYVSIVWYDLWKIKGGQARSEFTNDTTVDTWCWVFDQLKKNIVGKVNNVVDIEYGGDWDDGPIDIIVK